MLSADKANRRYFRQAYRTGIHGWAVEEPSPYAVSYLKRIRQEVPHGRLLDVGCGEGRHAIAAARLGFKVTACDYEPMAIRRARQFARKHGELGITFVEADVFRLRFPGSSFDVVVDYGCLHHQRKAAWRAYKAGILRVLKPGGFYVLSVFSPRFRLFRGSRRPWHIAQGSYRRCFIPRDIQELFGRDFEVIEMTEEKGDGQGFWHVLMRRRSGTTGTLRVVAGTKTAPPSEAVRRARE